MPSGGGVASMSKIDVGKLPYKTKVISDKQAKTAAKSIAKINREVKKNPIKKIPRDVFGNTKFVKFVYFAQSNLACSATQGAYGTEQAWRINSLSNPYVGQASGSVLPQSFEEMESIYSRYIVYGAKLTVRFFAPSSNRIQCGVLVTSSSDTQTLTGLKLTNQGSKKRAWIRYLSNTGDQEVVHSSYWKIGKVEGLNKVQFSGALEDYSGTVTTASGAGNPSKILLLHIAAGNMTSTSQDTLNCSVKIEYYAQLYEKGTLLTGTST